MSDIATTDTQLGVPSIDTLTMLEAIEDKLMPLIPGAEPIPRSDNRHEDYGMSVHAHIKRLYDIIESVPQKKLDQAKALMENPMIQRLMG